MKTDLDKIKDKYGEKFMHLCRSMFPTLNDMGILYETISRLFQPTKDLYDDIVKNKREDMFKNYVMTNVEIAARKAGQSTGDPFELIRRAGYTLYECKTVEEVMAFRKYWKDIEHLCTFDDPEARLENSYIFFAVKDGAEPFVKDENGNVIQEGSINGKTRSSFTDPLRQDEYGVSVIGIQFTRGEIQDLKILNRYNHTVRIADATFSNDLDNIQAGLTDAFAYKYAFNFEFDSCGFNMPGYVFNDGKLYKYNIRIGSSIGSCHFCSNNNAIIDGKFIHFDESQYELVDNFLIDKVGKTVVDLSGSGDSFCDAFVGYKKMDIKKVPEGRQFVVTLANDEVATFVVDKKNQIISYENNSLTEVGDKFLFANKTLASFSALNLTKVGDQFLSANKCLTSFDAPNLTQTGNDFLSENEILQTFHAPKLTQVGDNFLKHNKSLIELDLPCLTKTGDDFLFYNELLTTFNAQNLTEVGDYFCRSNLALSTFYAPNLTRTGSYFFSDNEILQTLYAPKLTDVGANFLDKNLALTAVDLSSLIKTDRKFLYSNQILSEFNAPNLTEVGDNFLHSNLNLSVLSLPSLTKAGAHFVDSNNSLIRFDAPNLTDVGMKCLFENQTLSVLNAPKLRFIGPRFLENHTNGSALYLMATSKKPKDK